MMQAMGRRRTAPRSSLRGTVVSASWAVDRTVLRGRWSYLSHFGAMRSPGAERSGHLRKVTQPVRGRAEAELRQLGSEIGKAHLKGPARWRRLWASRAGATDSGCTGSSCDTGGDPETKLRGHLPSQAPGLAGPPHRAALPAPPRRPDQHPPLFSLSLTTPHTSFHPGHLQASLTRPGLGVSQRHDFCLTIIRLPTRPASGSLSRRRPQSSPVCTAPLRGTWCRANGQMQSRQPPPPRAGAGHLTALFLRSALPVSAPAPKARKCDGPVQCSLHKIVSKFIKGADSKRKPVIKEFSRWLKYHLPELTRSGQKLQCKSALCFPNLGALIILGGAGSRGGIGREE